MTVPNPHKLTGRRSKREGKVGITQEEAARMLGVTRCHLNMVINGRRESRSLRIRYDELLAKAKSAGAPDDPLRVPEDVLILTEKLLAPSENACNATQKPGPGPAQGFDSNTAYKEPNIHRTNEK